MKKFILGFITGGIICATATGFAVEYAVTANPVPCCRKRYGNSDRGLQHQR